MNNIGIKQNEQKQLERLAAQRELYAAGKKIYVFQILTTVLIPIILSVIAVKFKDIEHKAACYGLFAILFDSIILERAIKRRKEKAAKIQELFDCDVLSLQASPFKIIDDVAVEEVLKHYRAHSKIASNIEKIKDWYPKKIQNLPLHIARLICQRENCWWDSNLRKRYVKMLDYLAITILIVMVCFGVMNNLIFVDLVLIGVALLPFFQFTIKQRNEHNDAVKRLDELRKNAEDLWKIGLDQSESEDLITEKSRRLQDEVFEHRSKSPLILDVFYNLLRNKDEELINSSTEQRLVEAKQKGFE
jgi:hypothetical protein